LDTAFTPLPSLTQPALTPICNTTTTTTTTTSYQHMPILLAMSTKAMLWVAVKNPITHLLKVAWRRQIHLIKKDRHYEYSLKYYIFALFL
jgi:hypothetical protein